MKAEHEEVSSKIPKLTVEPLPKKPAEPKKATEYEAAEYEELMNQKAAYQDAKKKRADMEKLFKQQNERSKALAKRVEEKEFELKSAEELLES